MKFHIASSIQTTDNGKISDTDNATQTIVFFQSLSYFILKTATMAEKIAIKKSIIFGFTLLSISSVSKFNQLNFVTKNQIAIAEKIEINKTFKDCINTLLHHFAIP
ncbi:MAG: hypothetical protein LBQ59_00325 [Candidatus Peribacteria bacterium]|nr:hypothetical protein [Candidatus Peribacteria bacterium]